MTEKPIWKGKGPIMYQINIYSHNQSQKPQSDFIDENWKYSIYIGGAGKYEDAQFGNNMEDICFFADTKDGIIRDLAMWLADQPLSDKEGMKFRGTMDWPPQILNLNNVEVKDYTDNKDFNDMDIPAIIANANKLGHAPLPAGERPFIVTIRDNEDYKNPSGYDIGVSVMDPMVYEEFENWGQYDIDFEDFNKVPEKDVNKTIINSLSERKKKWAFEPTINNTKIINFTDNPQFTLNRIFGAIKPLKIMQARPALKLTKKAPILNIKQPSAIIPIAPRIKKEPVPLKTEMENDEEKERLRA